MLLFLDILLSVIDVSEDSTSSVIRFTLQVIRVFAEICPGIARIGYLLRSCSENTRRQY